MLVLLGRYALHMEILEPFCEYVLVIWPLNKYTKKPYFSFNNCCGIQYLYMTMKMPGIYCYNEFMQNFKNIIIIIAFRAMVFLLKRSMNLVQSLVFFKMGPVILLLSITYRDNTWYYCSMCHLKVIVNIC